VFSLGLRWIIVALCAALCLLGTGIGLARWQSRFVSQQVSVPVPMDTIALPLDEHGVGGQVIAPARLTVRLMPYPPPAGQPVTLTLVVVDRFSGAVLRVQPYLEVSEWTQTDGQGYAAVRHASGAYIFSGLQFPQPGRWRLRLTIDFGTDQPYRTLILVDAR
jgi:hypothetical protein